MKYQSYTAVFAFLLGLTACSRQPVPESAPPVVAVAPPEPPVAPLAPAPEPSPDPVPSPVTFVDQPQSASTDEVDVATLEIHANQTFTIAGQRFTDLTAVREVLVARRKASPELRLVLVADKSTRYGEIIDAMDAVRDIGIVNIAFGVPKNP